MTVTIIAPDALTPAERTVYDTHLSGTSCHRPRPVVYPTDHTPGEMT